MKKRMRRFEEGGSTEAADKAEGLRKSAKDRVSLLDRIRMGNIDDPSSQAYKQLGAGRARAGREAADTQLESEVMRASERAPRMSTPAPAAPTPRPPAPPARPSPVDAGEVRAETGDVSSLRRNTETGDLYSPNAPITRPSAPMRRPAPAVRTRSVDLPSAKMSGGADEDRRTASVAQAAPAASTPAAAASFAATPASSPVAKLTPQAQKVKNFLDRFSAHARGVREGLKEPAMAKGGKVKSYANGGSVSSASTRADGCAMRGKTRGRIY